ncbi:MAG: hypothetical protein CMM87_06265 [Rickettsiales bacterium]|nr:hypothetical protein [Rickettsiales bacterium]|tara:strand:+ start:65521 stop:66426 length:906 start_codon:yes stop_codon:yes gene_type:complete
MRLNRKLFFSYLQAPIVLLIYGALIIIPLKPRRFFLSNFAKIIGPLLPVTRKAENNLALCYPESTQQFRKNIIADCWAHLGKIAAEFGSITSIMNKKNNFTIEGSEHLDQALEKNKGVIFFSAHLGNWEVCYADVLHRKIPIKLIARRQRNPIADWLINRTRKSQGVDMIPRNSLGRKTLLKTLKSGGFIGALFDVYDSEGSFIPFFNHPAKTTTSLARIAHRLDFLMLPVQVIRKPNNHFTIRYYPSIEAKKHKDEKSIMSSVNDHITDWIQENPEQWLWLHDRWKVKEKDLGEVVEKFS